MGTLNTPGVVIVVLIVVVAVNGLLFFRYHSPRVLIVAAGDIADCRSEGDEATARLVEGIDGATVLTLGDNVYQHGTAEQFAECYDPTWGRFKERTRPIPGNHDYGTKGASAYFEYFGDAAGDPQKGYYSYDLGSWHLVALNSVCKQIGGCGEGSAQLEWLRRDLAANPARRCTLAYVHDPLFSAGRDANSFKVTHIYEVLYAAGADVVLSGDYHNYQRFEPQDPDGKADYEHGIRQFVVGTGGKNHYAIESPIENLEVYNDDTFGVLKLSLNEGGYEWRFAPVEGKSFTDSGSGNCHGAPTTGTAPPKVISTVPTANATRVAPTTNVTVTFSEDSADMDEDMDASSINTKSFKLFKKGTTTKIAATVSYDAATDTATLHPDQDLRSGVTYKAVVSPGAKDQAGNPLAQPYRWFFTVR